MQIYPYGFTSLIEQTEGRLELWYRGRPIYIGEGKSSISLEGWDCLRNKAYLQILHMFTVKKNRDFSLFQQKVHQPGSLTSKALISLLGGEQIHQVKTLPPLLQRMVQHFMQLIGELPKKTVLGLLDLLNSHSDTLDLYSLVAKGSVHSDLQESHVKEVMTWLPTKLTVLNLRHCNLPSDLIEKILLTCHTTLQFLDLSYTPVTGPYFLIYHLFC